MNKNTLVFFGDNVFRSNIDSFQSKDYNSSGTLLEMVKSVDKMPVSFMKVGNSSISDVPCDNKNAEFGCIVFGNKGRKIVLFSEYGSNRTFIRDFFTDHWSTSVWNEITLK